MLPTHIRAHIHMYMYGMPVRYHRIKDVQTSYLRMGIKLLVGLLVLRVYTTAVLYSLGILSPTMCTRYYHIYEL